MDNNENSSAPPDCSGVSNPHSQLPGTESQRNVHVRSTAFLLASDRWSRNVSNACGVSARVREEAKAALSCEPANSDRHQILAQIAVKLGRADELFTAVLHLLRDLKQ